MKRASGALVLGLVLLVVAGLPFLSLLQAPGPGACLADPLSELPVKLWAYEAFHRPDRFFGGLVTEIRHPRPGLLNNPDMVGTLVVGSLDRALGLCGAYNLLVYLQLLANAAAAFVLGRQWAGGRSAGTSSSVAGLCTAITVGLMPLLLVYCVAGAITDMLNVWPYLLALHQLRVAWDGQRGGAAAMAGGLVALGFITCPYNLLIFAPALVPMGLLLVILGPRRLGLGPSPGWSTTLRLLALCCLGGVLVGGPYVAWLRLILEDPTSQMAADSVARSRHAPPYPALAPLEAARYTAYLADFVALGMDSVVTRDNVARFYRAVNPGLVALILGVIGAVLRGPRPEMRLAARAWLVVAIFFALAATGPFLPLTRDIALPGPWNPVWLGLHNFFPGSYLLLEPFRYALPLGASVGIAAAIGCMALLARTRLAMVLPALMVVELLTIAPVFRPMPTTSVDVPPVYAQLGETLPPGAIVELPLFLQGSKLFNRRVFLNQKQHGRPIPNTVEGYPPPYLVNNPAMATLIDAEEPVNRFFLRPGRRAGMQEGLMHLQHDGFVAIVVDPSLYRSPQTAAEVERLLRTLDPPERIDGRLIYRLR